MAVTAEFPTFTTPIPEPRMPLSEAERLDEATKIFAQTGTNVLREFPGVFDLEIVNAVTFPDESLRDVYKSGCAEPWTSQLVASLLIASNQRVVLETGGFIGQTSAWLALALERLGGGELTVVDIDEDRAKTILARLDALPLERTSHLVVLDDVLHYLTAIEDESVGFAFVDDCHEKPHVDKEVELLLPKMKRGGIVCFHDVFGSCDLKTVVEKYGGYSLDFPRLGPAGGLGIIQKR